MNAKLPPSARPALSDGSLHEAWTFLSCASQALDGIASLLGGAAVLLQGQRAGVPVVVGGGGVLPEAALPQLLQVNETVCNQRNPQYSTSTSDGPLMLMMVETCLRA